MKKLKKLKLGGIQAKRPVDPMEIWERLQLRGSIQNIWGPQEQALTLWHKAREKQDLVIQMNTGGGKTLVGLIAAQSLVNELKCPVVYVCPNIQLIQQTAAKCAEIGFSPALRYGGEWQAKDAFFSGETFCITNYAALFTGHSPFEKIAPGALIFDDAHVADQAIRGQFTITIEREHTAFEKIFGLYRKHYTNSGLGDRLEELKNRVFAVPLFVPMFVVFKHAAELRRLLLDNDISEAKKTLFAWERLKDHLSCCTVILAANRIEITPAVLPLRQLAYFGANARRVFLTATLPSQSTFARTFGISNPTIIQPGGKSGDAQRLFIFVNGETDAVQRDVAIELVKDKKSCVISPTSTAGKKWCPPAEIYDDSSDKQIEDFRNAVPPSMLALVARYDGIDLPGDSCHILILDGLPYGESLVDRFIDESLKIETVRQSHAATRIVQAIGRIFRSNTDHGIVLVVGPDLQQWLQMPRNRIYLPALVQKQLMFALELRKQVDQGETSWEDLMEAVLTGDAGWDENYNDYIDQFEPSNAPDEAAWYIDALMAEHGAYEQLWAGQTKRASELYVNLAESVESHEKRLAAWYQHWAGLCLLRSDDMTGAFEPFISAANVRAELGRPSEARDQMFRPPKYKGTCKQAQQLVSFYSTKRAKIAGCISDIKHSLVYSPGETHEAQGKVKKCQNGLRLLGELLGLVATQPDNQVKTGPDVVWALDEEIAAWGFELKTGKEQHSEYTKKADIGQCHDHEQWMADNFKGKNTRLSLVGYSLRVANDANPSRALTVIELNGFADLLARVKTLYEEIDAGDKDDLEGRFASWLQYHGLIWPQCVDSLGSRYAYDLKRDNA